MANIAPDLAKSILEKLINATLEHSRYMFCLTCITEDFEKERENLIAKEETVKERVRAANRRGDKIQRDVVLWQKQAKDLLEEDTKKKVTCFFGWCPNCKRQYSRGKELESKTKEIKRLIMESNFETVGIIRDVPGTEYHSSQNYISFKSRESKIEELCNALRDHNKYMIGLQGMGGTGKTTLAKEMGKQLKQSNIFDLVVDTTVSNTPNTKKIQDEIAGPLGLSLENCTESERPKRLWNRLTDGQKILIILDDVWGDISFEEIGIPYKDNHKGCRILVTTRDVNICHKMECEETIQLDILLEEDVWKLFQKHAGLNDSYPKSVLDTGRKISKECKGLPIAIVVIAGSLKGKRHLEQWDVALKSLQNFKSVAGDDENKRKIYSCLKYSYDNMQNKTAKKLFLLCSLFREDEEIYEELLVRLAIGGGLIEKNNDDYNYDAYRKEVIAAKYELIDSCLLLNCASRKVKMHDLVREVALWIANKEILAVNTSKKNEMTMVDKGKHIEYLLCEGKSMDVFSLKFDASKLDILIVYLNENVDAEVPNSFLENMISLRVLYLSNMTYRAAKATLSLPQSIQLLTNLKSLYLENFTLGDISIFGNLQGLETLEFVRCQLDKLPREIVKLVKLKLLKLSCCDFVAYDFFEIIVRCTSLEELYYTHNGISKMCHSIKLPNYQRFCISEFLYTDRFEGFLWSCLEVSEADKVFSKETFKNLAQKAEIVYLNRLQGVWKNMIPEIVSPDDEGMTNLVEITLVDISTMRCLIDNNDSLSQSVLSRLVKLVLRKMENLKEICNGPLPFELLKNLEYFVLYDCMHLEGSLFKSKISLCHLKWLYIEDCPMLTSLFEWSTTQSLLSLVQLYISNCEQLKSIVRDENRRKDSIEEIVDDSIISRFPNLTTLEISGCPQLHFILPMAFTRNIPKLKRIRVFRCDELKYLFGPYQHKHEEEDLYEELKDVIFTNLELMTLEDLPNFVDIFPKCVYLIFLKHDTFFFTVVNELQVNESNANDVIPQDMSVTLTNIGIDVSSNIFFTLQNVTELTIEEYVKAKVLFCASMLECFPYLRTLAISGCNELEQIIGEDTKNQRKPFFPRLKLLVLKECNKLKCIFPISTSEILPNLEVLIIVQACMLEEVFKRNSDEKVEIIPNLKTAVFVELPSLRQEIEFLTVKHCFMKNCPKLSLSSSLQSSDEILSSIQGSLGGDIPFIVFEELAELDEMIRNENARTEDSASGIEVGTTLLEGSELTSSHNNDEDNQHHENVIESKELEDAVKQSRERVEEEQQILGKAPPFGISSMPISQENEEGQNMEPATNKDVNDGDFEGTSNTVAIHSESSNAPGSEVTNQHIKNILQETMDDLREDPKTRESNQNEMTKVTEDFPSDTKPQVASGKNLSQITEDSTFTSVIRRELERLVSNKHLALENQPLLVDFLVKHPSVRLTDNTVSDRYKGFAYTCLAELLKFLQTHSVLDVLGSSHSEFVELLQDMRRFSFDRVWLDGVERRALLPGLLLSQDALQKLLHSKNTLIQHLEEVKDQLELSLTEQEEQVLRVKATLSTPLGY
ncbi:disease resistance protein RPS2 [Vigna unguiculata]|uniref:Disease resistance protein RPS2 n=1 Tax=Vigna unguiculata TaxID=3917 RepID=A0A4D6MYH8_VIGUN|nr:disease resistance protein RPS2 [Vigna unguiculata]